MSKHNRFRKGQSTFTCRSCGKRTRDVNGSNGSVELCELCDEQAMAENSLSDAGAGSDAFGVFDNCKTVDEVQDLLTAELEKLNNPGDAV